MADKISKVSPETRAAIARKSAQTLPNRPSEMGFSAEEIKRRFYALVTDANNSALAEIDRVVDEANDILGSFGVGLEDETTARETADSDLSARITQEITARENADTALSHRIDTEKTERTTALTKKADLGGDGKVLTSQLPSYVDDVLEYASKAAFPATGESGKIYVDLTTNLTWRWSGSIYVEISPSLALGETSATAYRGDRGKTAYDHSQASGNPHGTAFSDITGKATQAQLPPLKTVGGESIFGEGNIPTGGTGGNIDEIVEQVVSKIEITFDVI